jgi:D-sedoheptulose 7-phosphate isomerase
MDTFRRIVDEARLDHQRTVEAFLERHAEDLATLAGWCADSLRAGGKLLLFGNGGSASDAQHLAAEFVNRFDRDRPALAALALATDGSVLTSIGNDSSFDAIFSRQIEALGRAGDIAIGITTSGASPNVIAGLRAARRLSMKCAGLLGRDGGPAALEVDLALTVPGASTARIQETHILAGHLLCRLVEEILAASPPPDRDPISSS